MKNSMVSVALIGALAFVAGSVNAASYDLCAGAFDMEVPPGSGNMVRMWGFAPGGASGGACVNTPTVPGPALTVPPGDNTLTINLVNTLPNRNGGPTPVSVVIPGQITTMVPQRNPDGRVRSFTHETLPGGTGVYTWTDFQPGTYIYHSGSHPAVQVQMGLYGAATKDAAAGQAYAGVPYDAELMLMYSEIDPALHAAVAADDYGPGKGTTSTINYQPRFFLINGAPYVAGQTPDLTGAAAGKRLLIRFANAGLKTHVPMLQGADMSIQAEDGKPYPYPRRQYSVQLPAMKTKDAILLSTAGGRFPIYDRALALNNDGAAGPGGMLRFIQTAAAPATDTVTILRTRYNANLDELRVWANSDGAPTAVLTLQGHGTMPYASWNSNFDYRLFAGGVTANPGNATVTSDQGGSDTQAVPYTAPPVANDDAYSVAEGATLNMPAAGVLSNDTNGGWFAGNNALAAAVVSGPANGSVTLNADGSFTYVHDGSETTSDSFTYQANAINTNNNNVLAGSNVATVNLSVSPVNDPPVAVTDSATTSASSPVTVTVLANDSDVDGDPLSITAVTNGANGTVVIAGAGVTYTPNAAGPYSDRFTYTVSDGQGGSAVGTVNVNVTAAVNQAPVAADDEATVVRNTRRNPTAHSVAIDVTANDTDADGSIDATTVTISVPPSRGGAVAVDPVTGVVTYMPPARFRGTDVFKYTVNDNAGATSNEATVRVNVVRR